MSATCELRVSRPPVAKIGRGGAAAGYRTLSESTPPRGGGDAMGQEGTTAGGILAADIVNYSGLMEADEVGTLATIRTLRSELIERRSPIIVAGS
jgi:hypothetical protein